MNRRNFLGLMVGGVAAAAAVRTFPFRVFSFPKQVELYGAADVSSLINLTLERVSDQINENLITSEDTLISQFKSGLRRPVAIQLVSDVPHDNALSPTPLRNFLADSSSSFSRGE